MSSGSDLLIMAVMIVRWKMTVGGWPRALRWLKLSLSSAIVTAGVPFTCFLPKRDRARILAASADQSITMSYLSSNPATAGKENFAFLILFNSGLME